ncbi:MAG: 3-deoxy-manno-octulosonate cytidylyltransferase [Waddliaceae bacterium]|nr:3-deoxy-manno-octulosonate cytidylyltransferase [Waddliaceae bacterium]
MSTKVFALIPARYQSRRFPGKPLTLLHGKPLVQHCYESASSCALFDRVVIATDDQRIFDTAKGFGAEVVMTPESCPTGTDRIATALQMHPDLAEADIIVNVQGDEPQISATTVSGLIELLKNDPEAQMATAVVPLHTQEELLDTSVVKCVFDCNGNALYFSRAPIPYGHGTADVRRQNYYGHVGIYAFRTQLLLKLHELATTPLQQAEDLEQLRMMEHGHRIKVLEVEERILGVDTPDDLKKVEELV